jgi:glycosyltransferase involved in cell wall biosynthesis
MATPVPLHHFPESWADERDARLTGKYRPRVLFVGGDFGRKGGPDLLAAWRTGRFHERAALDVVSDAPAVPRIIDGLPGVRLHRGVAAHTPEWKALWHAADIFVMPSYSDAFPNVLQEAAAAALPAISSTVDAIPEIVRDGATGLLVEAGNRGQLIAALDTLLTSPRLRGTLGRAARTRVEQTAHPQTYRDRLSAIICRAARRSPECAD